ncbi:MAG: peptidase M23 [Flavobacteriales bacterium]|nr:peptidase M23 [Flavobacteriales bacterium]
MSKSKKPKPDSFLNFFFKSYKISDVNKTSLREKTITTFKGYHLFVYFLGLLIVLLFGVFLLIAYGPLNNLVPLTNTIKKKEIIDLIVRVDSLEKDLVVKQQYINVIGKIINGEVVDNLLPISIDSSLVFEKLKLIPSKEDSILRKMVYEEDLYNISSSYSARNSSLEDFVFFKPVNGLVIDTFNLRDSHYGVDVVTHDGASVKACLEGVVIFSDWSTSSGNMMLIQHIDNIISVYMHNSILTKKQNDLVKAGEVIGIVGNTGELSSGPHLHFELWQNGTPIDPQEYIDF